MIRRILYKKGDLIFKEGDTSTDAYRILRGRVEVSTEMSGLEKIILATLTVGDVFGEMAMIDESPRSATVTTLEETEMEVMSPDDFNRFFLQDPFQLTPYLSTLIERLRTTNERLRILMKQSQIQMQKLTRPPMPVKPSSLTQFNAKTAPAAGADVKIKLHVAANNPRSEKMCMPNDFVIDRFPYRIGRASLSEAPDILQKNDMCLRNVDPMTVARNHCIIDRDKNGLLVRDRGSKTGCIVNGAPIGEKEASYEARLNAGDNILVIGGVGSPAEFKLTTQIG